MINDFMALRKHDPLAWTVLISAIHHSNKFLDVSAEDLRTCGQKNNYLPYFNPLSFTGTWLAENGGFTIFQQDQAGTLVYREEWEQGKITCGVLRPVLGRKSLLRLDTADSSLADMSNIRITGTLACGNMSDIRGEELGEIELESAYSIPSRLAFRIKMSGDDKWDKVFFAQKKDDENTSLDLPRFLAPLSKDDIKAVRDISSSPEVKPSFVFDAAAGLQASMPKMSMFPQTTGKSIPLPSNFFASQPPPKKGSASRAPPPTRKLGSMPPGKVGKKAGSSTSSSQDNGKGTPEKLSPKDGPDRAKSTFRPLFPGKDGGTKANSIPKSRPAAPMFAAPPLNESTGRSTNNTTRTPAEGSIISLSDAVAWLGGNTDSNVFHHPMIRHRSGIREDCVPGPAPAPGLPFYANKSTSSGSPEIKPTKAARPLAPCLPPPRLGDASLPFSTQNKELSTRTKMIHSPEPEAIETTYSPKKEDNIEDKQQWWEQEGEEGEVAMVGTTGTNNDAWEDDDWGTWEMLDSGYGGCEEFESATSRSSSSTSSKDGAEHSNSKEKKWYPNALAHPFVPAAAAAGEATGSTGVSSHDDDDGFRIIRPHMNPGSSDNDAPIVDWIKEFPKKPSSDNTTAVCSTNTMSTTATCNTNNTSSTLNCWPLTWEDRERGQRRLRRGVQAPGSQQTEQKKEEAVVVPMPLLGKIRLWGLPYSATPQEIVSFLSQALPSVKEADVSITCRSCGRPTGEAFVQVPSDDVAREVKLKLHLKMMGTRYIEVCVPLRKSNENTPRGGIPAQTASAPQVTEATSITTDKWDSSSNTNNWNTRGKDNDKDKEWGSNTWSSTNGWNKSSTDWNTSWNKDKDDEGKSDWWTSSNGDEAKEEKPFDHSKIMDDRNLLALERTTQRGGVSSRGGVSGSARGGVSGGARGGVSESTTRGGVSGGARGGVSGSTTRGGVSGSTTRGGVRMTPSPLPKSNLLSASSNRKKKNRA